MSIGLRLTGEPAAEVIRGLSIPMRDGVRLLADAHGVGPGPRPVILERTPYDRTGTDGSERTLSSPEAPTRAQIAAGYVAAGFVYVVQDCRGTGGSDGVFDKYLQEPADGVDTLRFLRSQPWCDGRIGMVGHSYGAMCQVSAAATGEERIDAMVAECGGFSAALDSGIRQGGALDLKQATWAFAQGTKELRAKGREAELARMLARPVIDWLRDGPWAEGGTPLADLPARQASLAEFWQNGTDGPFWRRPGLYVDPAAGALRGQAILFVSSWHDTSLRSVIENFQASLEGPEAAGSSPRSALVIGPWLHGVRHVSHAGEADFGPEALAEAGLGASLTALRPIWIAERLAGAPLSDPRVRYFRMGGGNGTRDASGRIRHGGTWKSAAQWPPAAARPLVLLLSPGLLTQDHAMAPGAGSEPAIQSLHGDPDRPMPTFGGAINSGAPVMEGGMYDQSALFPALPDGAGIAALNPDLLSFATPPLQSDLALAGEVEADLWISTDLPDADLTIKLIDCYPDGGPALNLSDGILRLRSRDGSDRETIGPIPQPVRVTVQGFPVAALVRAGHRLRLDLAMSNFPHFDVNPQTGAPQGRPGPRRKGVLRLHTGGACTSALRLRQEEP